MTTHIDREINHIEVDMKINSFSDCCLRKETTFTDNSNANSSSEIQEEAHLGVISETNLLFTEKVEPESALQSNSYLDKTSNRGKISNIDIPDTLLEYSTVIDNILESRNLVNPAINEEKSFELDDKSDFDLGILSANNGSNILKTNDVFCSFNNIVECEKKCNYNINQFKQIDNDISKTISVVFPMITDSQTFENGTITDKTTDINDKISSNKISRSIENPGDISKEFKISEPIIVSDSALVSSTSIEDVKSTNNDLNSNNIILLQLDSDHASDLQFTSVINLESNNKFIEIDSELKHDEQEQKSVGVGTVFENNASRFLWSSNNNSEVNNLMINIDPAQTNLEKISIISEKNLGTARSEGSNDSTKPNEIHTINLGSMQISKIDTNTEINDTLKNNLCLKNANVETGSPSAECNDDIFSSTNPNATKSNKSHLINVDSVLVLNLKKPEELNDNNSNDAVGIDCVDFKNPSTENSVVNIDQNVTSETILADFHSNKAKAASNNLMLASNEQDQTQLEPKFPRSHKEIITPDFGYIVKNVHGIFSSVSGSLKNAYNISHRPNTNYNILKYGNNLKKEEKTSDVLETITDISKGSVDTSNQQERNNLELNAKSDDTVSKSSISSTESSGYSEKIGTDLNKKSEPNSPINNVAIQEQKSMASTETLASNNDDGNNMEIYRLQIQSLETSLAEQRKEVASLRDRGKQQSEELMNKDHICKDMESKMDMMRKRVERAERDADASVMRYATSERAVLEARSAADSAKKAEKQAVAEAELLNGKLRSAHAEKARICRLLDDKIHELSQSDRELNKLKEEIRATDTKLKWTQNKLRTEMDAYKESTAQIEKITEQLSELQSQVESTQVNVQDSIRAKDLESQLQQSQASLILERHERERAESKLKLISSQAEISSAEVARNSQELEELRVQVKKLSAKNLELEEEAVELATLRAKAALSDTLTTQLQSERARAFAAEECRAGAEARGAAAALREGAALEHAAKVTAEHVAAQARAHQHEAKALALAADNVSLRERLSFLESEVTRLQTELSAEAVQRRQQTEAMSLRMTGLEQDVEDARRKLEWEVGESAVLKKKHASSYKELNRELQRALKRCQYLEGKYSTADEKNGLSNRTGSITSLNSLDAQSNCRTSPEDGRVNGHTSTSNDEVTTQYQSEGPSRQMLIERVVELQRAAARRAERCDFLEEHTRALTTELRNKTRLVRHLAAAQPSGALDTPQRDQHKNELARKGGGAMAAVYGGESNGLTLELSLEMNRKLQAVLEDALLKNITLRENMDTLGAEIARLKTVQP